MDAEKVAQLIAEGVEGDYPAPATQVLEDRQGIRPGAAVRGASTPAHWGETGMVVSCGPIRTKVRWTSGETTWVRYSKLQPIRRQP